MNQEELEKEMYIQCFNSKHHYDVLSWTISGALVIILGALLGLMLKLDISDPNAQNLRYILALLGFSLIFIWLAVYERNRFWGEVANETAREIERKYGLVGPSIAFMKASIDKRIWLKNLDENGDKYKKDPKPESPLINISMHWGIRMVIAIMSLALVYLVCNPIKI